MRVYTYLNWAYCRYSKCFTHYSHDHLDKSSLQRKKTELTFRNLSTAPLVSNISFPCSSVVTAASLAKVTPEANGCPELLQNAKLILKLSREQTEYKIKQKG